MPLYWIMILAIIRITIGDTVLDPVNTPHGQAALMNSTLYLRDETIHVAPNTKEASFIIGISHLFTLLFFLHHFFVLVLWR